MIEESSVYKIGVLTRTHGVRGEISFTFSDDVWDRVDADYLVLLIDGILVPFFLEEYRFRSDSVGLLKFLGYDSAETVQELCGAEVYFPYELTPQPDENDEYTWRYFTGFHIVDTKIGDVGVIDSVDDSTANILFQVGDLLVPAASPFIREVDHQKRVITMELPEGLIEL